jgi:hypothetical protein
MPLPIEVDTKIRKRFGDLIAEAESLAAEVQRINGENLAKAEHWMGDRHQRGPGPRLDTIGETDFFCLRTKALSLLEMFVGSGSHITTLRDEILSMQDADFTQRLCGILKGLKDDYKQGMLEPLVDQIEANVTADYLSQVEQLLKEGTTGNYDHIPAAVLTGAILEDSLRRLCQRQNPPISLERPDNSPKMLNTLISDLKKAKVFNELKAKNLRAWAGIRNAAAHGNFAAFNRQDVERMLSGVQHFLADYL